MRDPKRILAKLVGKNGDADSFEATGEPLELVVESLREVVQCRKTRQWILESFGFDVAVSPSTFHRLLDLPQINFVENSNRMLEVEQVSLKETRSPEDPVTVGNLNTVLREIYRDLFEVREKMQKEFPDLLLSRDMSGDLLERVSNQTRSLRVLHGKLTGYLLTGGKVKTIEEEFRAALPRCDRAHPLRQSLPRVEHELELYRHCTEVNRKWNALGMDLFVILREEGLPSLLDNLEELGNLLWQLVYKSPRVRQSLELAGIEFTDVCTLFDPDRVPINNM